jgi:hypothetical protein
LEKIWYGIQKGKRGKRAEKEVKERFSILREDSRKSVWKHLFC